MWKCSECGREFKNTGQHHFCGEINKIDDYIAEQAEDIQPMLHKIREVIRDAAPEAVEKIAWRMPTFWQGENIIHFAAFKKHIGIYPGGEATDVFAERLQDYKTSKGAIQFPLKRDESGKYEPLDYTLISDIVKWRLSQL